MLQQNSRIYINTSEEIAIAAYVISAEKDIVYNTWRYLLQIENGEKIMADEKEIYQSVEEAQDAYVQETKKIIQKYIEREQYLAEYIEMLLQQQKKYSN